MHRVEASHEGELLQHLSLEQAWRVQHRLRGTAALLTLLQNLTEKFGAHSKKKLNAGIMSKMHVQVAIVRFKPLCALPWLQVLRPVFVELTYNLESFNPAFTSCLLMVQRTIGLSDYVRRDMALKNLIQPLAGEYGMHNDSPQRESLFLFVVGFFPFFGGGVGGMGVGWGVAGWLAGWLVLRYADRPWR